jgi:hypothetical protein
MHGFPRPRFWRSLRHRLAVAGTFFAYLLATLPLPLPASVHKDGGLPFPCQNHPCGCQTAEQCWRHCCCFTPEERWAWARENNVEPPDYAAKPAEPEKPVEEGWNTVKLRDRTGGESKRPTKSCCSARQNRPSCCQPRPDDSSKQSSRKSQPIRWVSAMSAWHCHGGPTLWLSVAVALPIIPAPAWSPDPPPASRVPLMNARSWDVSLNPPSPPPRPSIV